MNTTNTAAAPTVNFSLHHGNAWEVLAGFLYAARRAGWTDEQLKDVTTKCTAGDNKQLMCTLAQFTVSDYDTNAQYQILRRDDFRKQAENVLADTGADPKNVGVHIAIYQDSDDYLHAIATFASALDGSPLGIAVCYVEEFDDPFELLEVMKSHLEKYKFDAVEVFDEKAIHF